MYLSCVSRWWFKVPRYETGLHMPLQGTSQFETFLARITYQMWTVDPSLECVDASLHSTSQWKISYTYHMKNGAPNYECEKMILPVTLTGERYITNMSWKWVPQSMCLQTFLQEFLISERQPLLNCNLISILNYASYTPNITRQKTS